MTAKNQDLDVRIDIGDLERFKLKYSLGQDDGRGSSHFLRIKVTEGAVTSDQLRGIAQLSDDYGRGLVWITDRQSIQLHWVRGVHALEIFSRLEEIGFTTDKCGQAYPGAGYGDVRNICVCPVTGFERGEMIDVRPLAKEMNEFFIGNEDFLDMPKKFKISISACDVDCARAQMQDLGFFALKHDGKLGFGVVVGGSLGVARPGPVIGKPLNVFILPEEVFQVAKNMVEIHRDHSNRENKLKARFKWLIKEWGIEKLRAELEKKLGRKLERLEYPGPEISGKEHVGIQEQEDGNYYINVPLIGGGLSGKKLRKAAEISDKYGTGDLRTTPYQNLILLNIPEGSLDEALEELKKVGLPVEGSRLRWESVGCAADFCANSANFHPKGVVRRIIENLEGQFGEKLRNFEMKIGVSGCSRDCGLKGASDIGLLGASAGNGTDSEEYVPFVGGRFGADPKFASTLSRKANLRGIEASIEGLIETSLERGYKGFQDLCEDHTIHELRRISESERGK